MKKLLAIVLTLIVLTLAFTACGAKSVIGIEIDEGLIREYNLNATPDFSGIKATVKYNDESTKSVTADDLTFGALDTTTAGTKQLAITYSGYTITVDIVVKGTAANTKKVTSITVTEGIATSYDTNSTPDFSGIKATIGYNDGTTKGVTAEDLTIGTVDTTTAGEKKLAITYDGFTTEVKVVILPPVTVTGITVTEGILDKYEFGSTPDFSGIKATVTYSNGTTENVEFADLTVGTLDTNTAGVKDLTVTYKGYTVYIDVTVLAPVVITEIIVTEGIEDTYDVDSTPDFSGIKATVKYSNGTSVDVAAADLEIGTVDTSTAGQKILEIVYGGFTEQITITVVDFITGIKVTDGSIALEYAYGSTPDFSTIKATVFYSDDTSAEVSFADLTIGNIDTTLAGKQNLKIEYDGFVIYVSVTVLPPVTITGITVTEGIEDKYNVGSTPDFSGIKATVTYSDGSFTEVTFEDLVIGALDTATAGEKKLSITFDNYETFIKITVVVPAHVTNIKVTAGIADSYDTDSTPDFSDIKATVIYSDGSEKYVTFEDLTIGTIDTSTAGEKSLSITYDDFTVYVEIMINEPEPEFEITGASLPSSLTNRNEYKKNFRDQNKAYIVGDDNAFTLVLIVTAFDRDDNMVSNLEYIGSSLVYLVTDDGETLVGEEFVIIDEINHTYDFTEAAIGKTFRIVTRPAEGIEDDMIDDVTSELLVTVVDGYNITNAKELNIITNTNDDMNDDGNGGEQLDNVNTFLKNNGIVRPENLKAVIIHNNLVITQNDLPEGYFVTYTKDGVTKTELYDWASIYYRTLTAEEPTFAVYGNYYTIYSYELPNVVAYGYGNQEDEYSNSQLFKFEIDNSLIVDGADLTPYHATMDDLALVDSHPNTNDERETERSMRGLIGVKVRAADLTLSNVNMEKFFISVTIDGDYTTIAIDKCTLYNSWQGHVYLWAQNYPQTEHETPWASHKPSSLTITDSSLTKCGGPVLLAQNADPTFACNANSGVITEIDEESVLESWVTGEEAWFNAVGVKPLAMQIKQLSALLTLTGANYGKNASFVKVDGNLTYINLIYVNMSAGDGALLTGADVDGKVTIGETVVLNQNDGENTIVDQYASTVGQAMGAVPPVFQSSAGGTCFGNPGPEGAGCYNIDFATLMGALQGGADPATAFMAALGAADATCFDGEYITLYYNGMAILLSYMN